MWRWQSVGFFVRRYLLSAACTLWTITSSAAAQESLSTLQSVRLAYQSVSSVHLQAQAEVRVSAVKQTDAKAPTPHADTVGAGNFEYWADGEKYRVRCMTDRLLGLAHDIEYSFDGTQFRMLDYGSSMLSYQQKNAKQLATALPNPFFLPIEFMSADSDACDACVLTLPQARDERIWNQRLEKMSVEASAASDGSPTASTRVEMERGGIPFTFRVVTGESRVERIDRVRPDGTLLSTTSFEYANSSDILPRRILIRAVDDQARTSQEVEFLVTSLEINKPIPADVFRIAEKPGFGVWDSDAKTFVKPLPKASIQPTSDQPKR